MTSSRSDSPESCYNDISEYPTSNSPLIQRGGPDRNPPNHFKTALLCLISLTLGLVQTIPLSILIPESLNLGLSTAQASLILAAWPASSLLVLLIQPLMNRLKTPLYLILTALINSAGFCSFYYSVTVLQYYLYLAVLARFTCGTTLFLINNKTAVGITEHLRGNVSKSSTLWEVFNSAGQACGAYIGSLLDSRIGFPLSMAVSGGTILVTVVILSCFYPSDYGRFDESTDTSTRDTYRLYVSRDMLIYCWCPMVCIGGCMVYVEGIITLFYLKEFLKSLQFGGVLIGLSGIVYCISATVIGLLRERWPSLTMIGLVLGLFGSGVVLPFIGPIVSLPGEFKLYLSVATFNLLLVCSCAIQLNSLTVSAAALTKILDSQTAMSVSLNAVNVAYNLGAFVGPIIGGNLLTWFSFSEVFAIGAPFFILAAVIVGVSHVSQNRSSNHSVFSIRSRTPSPCS